MPEQFSLDGFDDPAKPTDRLFFAIFPDAESADRIAAAARQLRHEQALTGTPLEARRFHVTLHHLGDHLELRQDIIAAARQAAAAIELPAFEVAFDRAASFSGRRGNCPFVLQGGDGNVALKSFQKSLGEAMRRSGIGRWVDASFTPHVTLLYDQHMAAEQAITPVHWTCREFVLVHSLLGRHRHIALGRWPLRDGGAHR